MEWLEGRRALGQDLFDEVWEPDDYRVPDRACLHRRELATFLPTAVIVVGIVSPGDESYAKFGFYSF